MELSYVLITPYSIRKSRTEGIAFHVLSGSRIQFTGATILAERIVQLIVTALPNRHCPEKRLQPWMEHCVAPALQEVDAVNQIFRLAGPTETGKLTLWREPARVWS
jgi:hypothetical protein